MAYLMDDEENDKLKSDAGPGSAPASSANVAAPAGSAPKYTQSSFTSGKKLLQKNAQGGSPDLTSGIRDSIAQNQKGLGESRDAYQKSLADLSGQYNFGADDVLKSAKTGGADFDKIKGLLGGPGDVAAFDYKPNVDIQDINRLQSEAGTIGALREKAQKGGDYSYGRGQASLDAYLFGKSPGGRTSQVQDALAQRKALQGQTAEAIANQGAARDQTLAGIQSKIGDTQGALKSRLDNVYQEAQGELSGARKKAFEDSQGERKRSLLDQAKKKAAEMAMQYSKENPDSMAAYDSLRKYGYTDKDITEELQGRFYEQLREQALGQSGKLSGSSAGYLDGNQYFSPEKAAEFNRINELLGNKDRREASEFGFNTDLSDQRVNRAMGEATDRLKDAGDFAKGRGEKKEADRQAKGKDVRDKNKISVDRRGVIKKGKDKESDIVKKIKDKAKKKSKPKKKDKKLISKKRI